MNSLNGEALPAAIMSGGGKLARTAWGGAGDAPFSLLIGEELGGADVSESEALAVGDWVELRFLRAREGPRQGRVVGVYEKFFNVHFGHYQESFLWVDVRIGELRAAVVRKAACQMAV